jgi:putative toxin-antitoxin system antitoxin component (TIGR02293 family)
MSGSKKAREPAAGPVVVIEEQLKRQAFGERTKLPEAAPGTGGASKAKERLKAFRELGLERETPQTEAKKLGRVADLLGGARVLKRKLNGPLDAHEMLLEGLPGKALGTLVENLTIPKSAALEKAIGMSLRTVQRHKDAPSKPLSQEQSGRIWKFAEILAKATAVLGSQEEVEKWLDSPAIGLNQRRPLDLLATPAGVELVEDFLERLEYGVYA